MADADEIIKSPYDKKLYRHLVLDNGLRVLLIHDPDITKDKEGGEGTDHADVSRV